MACEKEQVRVDDLKAPTADAQADCNAHLAIRNPKMNKSSGRVVLKESGVGIPDALVVIYELDLGTQPEEVIPPTPTRAKNGRLSCDPSL